VRVLAIALIFSLLAVAELSVAEEHHHEHHEHEHKHEESGKIHLSDREIEEFGIETARVGTHKFLKSVELPGEIEAIPGREAEVAAPLEGFIEKIYKKVGERVKRGERLAALRSPELAELKSSYLKAREERALLKELLRRAELLYQKGLIPEEELLERKRELSLKEIEARGLAEKLKSFGFSRREVERSLGGEYLLKAPISGVVVEMDAAPGELAGRGEVLFKIVNLSKVWAKVWIYKKWLSQVREGSEVEIVLDDNSPPIRARIEYIEPIVDEEKKAVKATITLDNANNRLKPGLLLKARVAVGGDEEVLAVPEGAIVILHGKPTLFVKEGEEFSPRHVKLGRKFNGLVEIIEGVKEGEEVVVSGAFTLKAEIEKEAFKHAGHAH